MEAGNALGVVPEALLGRRLTLRLCKVVMRGFKVFSKPTVVGPLDGFSCVMGPNGSGKSVLGDAIAFALGANARMLRVDNLSQVISTCPDDTGAVLEEAEVTLHFYIADATNGDLCGALGVRRSVNRRSGRTSTAAAQCWLDGPFEPLPSSPRQELASRMATEIENSGEEAVSLFLKAPESSEDGAEAFGWVPCGQSDLAALLEPYGLDLHSLERVVVAQHRRADAAAHPDRLAAVIEAAVGGEAAAAAVSDAVYELEQANEVEETLDVEYQGLMDRTEELGPAVSQWRRFTANKSEYLQRAAEVMAQHASSLGRQETAAAGEREAAEVHARELAMMAKDACKYADLQLEECEYREKVLQDAKAEKERLRRRLAEAQQAAQRAGVRRDEAVKEAKRLAAAVSTPAQRKAMEKKAGKLGRRAAALAEEVAALRAAVAAAFEAAAEAALIAEEEAVNAGAEGKVFLDAKNTLQKAHKDAFVAQQAAENALLDSQLAAEQASIAAEVLAKQEATLAVAQKSYTAAAAEAAAATAAAAQLEEAATAAKAAAALASASLEEHQTRVAALERKIERVEAALEALGSVSGGLDAAVRRLAGGAAGAGFYGRLHSLLRATAPGALVAVNAVLMERCNPAATVAVATRAVAEAAVAHCRDTQAGWITCRVLDELNNTGHMPQTLNSVQSEEALARAVAAPGTAMPLAALVAAAPGVPGSEALRADLFDGWLLVDCAASAAAHLDSERAVAATSGRRPRPLRFVTLGGALLKADGEAVGEKSRIALDNMRPYLLGTAFVEAAGGSGDGAPAAASSDRPHQLAARLEELQQELVRAKHAQNDALKEAAMADGVAGGAVQRAAEGATRAEAAGRAASKAEFAVATAATAMDKSRTAAEKAEEMAAVVAGALREAEDAATAASAARMAAINVFAELTVANPIAAEWMNAVSAHSELSRALAEKEGALAEAVEAAEAAQARCARAHFLIQEAEEKAKLKEAAVKKAVEAERAVQRARESHTRAERDVADASAAEAEALMHWREAVRVHQLYSTALQEELATAAALKAREEEARADAVAAQREVTRLHFCLQETLTALSDVPSEDGQEEEQHGDDQFESAGAVLEDGGGDGGDSAGSDTSSDSESLAKKRARLLQQSSQGAGTPRVRRRVRRASRDTIAAAQPWEDAEIESVMAELRVQEDELRAMEESIDLSAVREAVQVHRSLESVKQRLGAAEAATAAAEADLAAKKKHRFDLFSKAMDAVDDRLRVVYRELTGGTGDAAAVFNKNPEMAFYDGVKLRVHPENGSWTEFHALSGGQKALAAAALSLALTTVAPAPFFFFDEIDAALDSINAERLARVLERHCGDPVGAAEATGAVPPQVIAVSHRLPMQDAAGRVGTLVQVTSCVSGAAVTHYTITLCPRKAAEEAMGAAEHGQ